ncbi:MAG: hypothetical protein K0R25_279 [Rickettsiaceae bacterium]|jgi:ribA/ribD-fused uncharacterized protein|nr:hypothetical protein [Rickettsiaceae bacterium]
MTKIRFYNIGKRYYEFTNFYEGKEIDIILDVDQKIYKFKTSEHAFQALKFELGSKEFYAVLNAKTPREVFDLANSKKGKFKHSIRADWEDRNTKIEVMDAVLECKFTQDEKLKKLLLDTGNAELIEDSPEDSFWGVGEDGSGRNELGKALMRLRAKLLEHDKGEVNKIPIGLVRFPRREKLDEDKEEVCGVIYSEKGEVLFKETINNALKRKIGLLNNTDISIGEEGQLTFKCGGRTDAIALQAILRKEGYGFTQGKDHSFTIDFTYERNSYGFLKYSLKFSDEEINSLANSNGGKDLGLLPRRVVRIKESPPTIPSPSPAAAMAAPSVKPKKDQCCSIS